LQTSLLPLLCSPFFFLHHPSTPSTYPLSLHDALPIYTGGQRLPARHVFPTDELAPDSLQHAPRDLRQPLRRHPREQVHPLVIDGDRKSTRLNSSHVSISYAVFCLKKKKTITTQTADKS